jgi:hypothetical protein
MARGESSRISAPRIEINPYGDAQVLYYFLSARAKQSTLREEVLFQYSELLSSTKINSLSLFSE